jgi:hypothetical protein
LGLVRSSPFRPRMRPNTQGTPGPRKIPLKKISVVRLTPPRNPIPAQSHPFPSLWPMDVRGKNIELELWEKTPASTLARGGRRRAGGDGGAGEEVEDRRTATDCDPSQCRSSRRCLLGGGGSVQLVGGGGAGATIPSGGRLLSGEAHRSYPSSLISLCLGFLDSVLGEKN